MSLDFGWPNALFGEIEYSVVDEVVSEKYYFSDKAVEGMRNAKKDMNKGRIQDLSKPCNTVGSHLAKVSLNSTDPVLYTNGRYRRFTPREVARIQSFPDSFELVGSEAAQYRALGNAIAPVMFWHIANQLSRQVRASENLSKIKVTVSAAQTSVAKQ